MGRETIAAAGTDGLEIWTAYVAREGLQLQMTPVGLRAMVAPLGCLCGLALGELFVVTCRSIPVAHSERLRRALVGSILVAIVYGAVHALLPVRGESELNLACRFGGAALLGLTVTGLAPWLFGRLGWIGEETRSADDAPVSD